MNLDKKYLFLGGGALLIAVGGFLIYSYISSSPKVAQIKNK